MEPKAKLYRVADAFGLCIEVAPRGVKESKLWRFRYRYAGKPKMLALGAYPIVTLEKARQKRDDARRLLSDGINPMEKRRGDAESKKRKERGMFPVVATEWLAFKRRSVGDETYRKAKLVVEGDLIPVLRRHAIADLATKDSTRPLRDIAERAPNFAAKARQYLGGIVDYATKVRTT